MPRRDDYVRDAGLLILRLVAGGFMLKHGMPKLRDTDGEYAKSFESLGFHPGATFVSQAGAVETSSALLIALGALGPIGPMLLLSDMIVATASVADKEGKFDLGKHEIEALYAAISIALILGGFGKYSIDGLTGFGSTFKPWMRCLSIAAAAGGAVRMLSARSH
jgi:putative oxidoreductase